MWSRCACFVSTSVFFADIGLSSDVLSSGNWLKAASLSDSLSDMVPGLIDLQLDTKAPSTVLKYKPGWLRWREWALFKFLCSRYFGKTFAPRTGGSVK